jgi:predicted RNA-binding protein with PUA-like domain
MAYWLLKTEPSTYGYADLERERETAWTGVTNPQAQGNLRRMKPGDTAVIYHSGVKEAVGLAEVSRPAYPDPEAGDARLSCVDVRAVARLRAPVPLEALKKEKAFEGSPLVSQGRLSVVPLTAEQWKAIQKLAGRASRSSAGPSPSSGPPRRSPQPRGAPGAHRSGRH